MPADDGSTIACEIDAVEPVPPVVNDNCGNVIQPTGPVVGGTYQGCEGTITYTWNYEDCEGNNHDWVYTYNVVVEDFQMPADDGSTVACEVDAVEPVPPVVNDNCGNVIQPTGPVVGGTYQGCEGTITYTWTYTDCAGNNHDWVYTYTVVVEDFQMPADDGSTVACESDAVEPVPPVVNDNCGNVIQPTGPEIGGTYLDCEGTITYTWTYADCAGNNHDWVYTYNIEVGDFQMPDNASMNIECSDDATEPVPPVVNDNCGNPIIPTGPVVVISPDPIECIGTITYTWSYADCTGNGHDWVFTYNVEDTTPPELDVVASDMTVECDGAGNQQDLADWLASIGGASATDNCSDVLWSDNYSGLSDDCGETGSATVTFTATDTCGNEVSTTATFTIVDTTAPILVGEIVPEIDVICDGVIPDVPVLEFEDSCSSEINVVFEETSTDNGDAEDYVITRVWTVTDDCGNELLITQVINVQGCGVLGVTFEIFNGVTPDGDGLNDYFQIDGIEDYPINNMKIFNRWGVLVWDTDGYGVNGNVFRGVSNGRSTIREEKELPTGTYYYILTFPGAGVDDNPGKNNYTGYLYINR
jgi:gliding motility-associated-like protein